MRNNILFLLLFVNTDVIIFYAKLIDKLWWQENRTSFLSFAKQGIILKI